LAVRQYCLDKHLIGRFGSFGLRAITPEQITDFRADLLKAGNSIGHVNKLVNMLATIFDDAINDGYLKTSPMPRGRREKKDRGKKSDREKARALTYEQAQKLLAGAEGNSDFALVLLLGLLAGLRRGEIFALDFSDIEWDKDLIHVRRNLVWLYGKHHKLDPDKPKYVIYTPKTKNSIREIDLSPKLKDALWTRYMEMQMEGKTGLIFQSQNGSIEKKDGKFHVKLRGQEPRPFSAEDEARKFLDDNKTPVDPKNIEERWFKAAVTRILEKADLERDEETHEAFLGFTLHHLRHTFGSWKIAQGEDVVYVSKQMGHSKPSVTYNVYAHLIDKRRPKAAALTDEKLFGKAADTKPA
jgi:integrase